MNDPGPWIAAAFYLGLYACVFALQGYAFYMLYKWGLEIERDEREGP